MADTYSCWTFVEDDAEDVAAISRATAAEKYARRHDEGEEWTTVFVRDEDDEHVYEYRVDFHRETRCAAKWIRQVADEDACS
jgi:hypothetical protein